MGASPNIVRFSSCKLLSFVLFSSVQIPHGKQLASLQVEEFDLRLDEGMVRWAQGLADRVLWTLVLERRADEMSTWPLPDDAFSYQVNVRVLI